MKNKKPIYFVYTGSSIIAATSLLTLLFVNFTFSELSFWLFIITPIITFTVSYFIFHNFVVKYINEKLKVLYRSIQKEKTKPNDKFSIKITDDVFTAAERATQIFAEESKKEILGKVWGTETIVGERTIDVHIRKLREKLGDDYIRTIKGVGYTFVDSEK